jgi:hypothetical protein
MLNFSLASIIHNSTQNSIFHLIFRHSHSVFPLQAFPRCVNPKHSAETPNFRHQRTTSIHHDFDENLISIFPDTEGVSSCKLLLTRKRNFVPNYSVILTLQLYAIKSNQFDMEGNVLSEGRSYIAFLSEISLRNAGWWLMVAGKNRGEWRKSSQTHWWLNKKCYFVLHHWVEIAWGKKMNDESYWRWSWWRLQCQCQWSIDGSDCGCFVVFVGCWVCQEFDKGLLEKPA